MYYSDPQMWSKYRVNKTLGPWDPGCGERFQRSEEGLSHKGQLGSNTLPIWMSLNNSESFQTGKQAKLNANVWQIYNL